MYIFQDFFSLLLSVALTGNEGSVVFAMNAKWMLSFEVFFDKTECIYAHKQMSGSRHQMETFSVLLVLCAGNSPSTGEFPSQRPVRGAHYALIMTSL